jgi:hypothetical protein
MEEEKVSDRDMSMDESFASLVRRVNKANPSPADIEAIRAELKARPDIWRVAGDLAKRATNRIIEKSNFSTLIEESVKQGIELLKFELGYNTASSLERLLIDQVLLCWLKVYLLELICAGEVSKPNSYTANAQLDRIISSAQHRYLRACETLARIRKLDVSVQVNIAMEGGKQINIA